MVRTSFITESDSIEKTEAACRNIREDSLHDDGIRAADAIYARRPILYEKMLDDLKNLQAGKRDELLFLYGRFTGVSSDHSPIFNKDWKRANGIWSDSMDHFKRENPDSGHSLDETELLLNLICAKTPTPSTILDVWYTTKRFFDGIAGNRTVFSKKPDDGVFEELPALLSGPHLKLGAQPRAWFEVNLIPGEEIPKRDALTAHTDSGSKYEVVFEGQDKRFWLVGAASVPKGLTAASIRFEREGEEPRAVCRVVRTGVKPNAYFPWRCISSSPDLLLLLAPADKAIEITEAIYKRYRDEFGKAYGRLPLSIGHVFFAEHQPMFSVLDAARRMEENFRTRHEGPPEDMELPVSTEELTLRLGTGEEDWHHPYMLVPDGQENTRSFFKTVEGSVVRIGDLAAGQKVRLHQNWYDAEFLGASAHRFRLYSDARKAPGEGPILLEKLIGTRRKPGMVQIWNGLCESGATNTSVRNFEQAIAVREAAWRSGGTEEARGAARVLARSIVAHYLPGSETEVLNAMDDELFFRTLNLYLRILKRPVEKPVRPSTPSDREAATIDAGTAT